MTNILYRHLGPAFFTLLFYFLDYGALVITVYTVIVFLIYAYGDYHLYKLNKLYKEYLKSLDSN